MRWLKLDTGIHRNPRIRRAGRDARDVFILLLCLNSEYAFNGEIPAQYIDPDYLATDLQMGREAIEAALVTLCHAGLLARVTSVTSRDAVSVRISGWGDEWAPMPKTDRERQARRRASVRDDSNGHAMSRDVTRCHAVTLNRGDVEETRREEKQDAPARAGAANDAAPPSSVKRPKADKPAPGPEAVTVAEYLLAAIRSHLPDAKDGSGIWARDIDLAIRADGRTPEALMAAIDYAHRSEAGTFWRANLLSGAKLRKHMDTLQAQLLRPSPGLPARRDRGMTARELWDSAEALERAGG